MKELKGIKWEAIFTQILVILLGIVLLFNPETTARTVCYIIGMIIMAAGVIKILSYFLTSFENNWQKNSFVSGAVLVMVGILFMVKVEVIMSIIPIIMGIFVLLSGVGKLQAVFDLRRMKSDGWIGLLIIAIINIALGGLLFSDVIRAAKLMIRVVGACMIYSGVTDLVNIIYMSKKMSDYIKDMQALEQDSED